MAVRPTLPADAGSGRTQPAPLLAIRYMHTAKSAADFPAKMNAIQRSLPEAGDSVAKHAIRHLGDAGVGKVRAASVAEIAAALANLQANEEMLSEKYKAWFYGLSAQHSASAFRPSFLVPPAPPKAAKPPPICTGCNRRQAEGEKFQQCGRCGSFFCSKDCLSASWKEHKKVCRKTEEKLRPLPDDGLARASVVYDMRPPPELAGKFMSHISMTGGPQEDPRHVKPQADIVAGCHLFVGTHGHLVDVCQYPSAHLGIRRSKVDKTLIPATKRSH